VAIHKIFIDQGYFPKLKTHLWISSPFSLSNKNANYDHGTLVKEYKYNKKYIEICVIKILI
jgi:hypothetical protein